MGMTLPERIRFIRKNLVPARQKPGRSPHMTLDEFAVAVGAPDRHGPMAWEKGRTPRDYASQIARLTPYPSAAVGGDGGEELLRNTLGTRLRALEAKVSALPTHEDLQRGLDTLRVAIDALANPGTGEDHAAGANGP